MKKHWGTPLILIGMTLVFGLTVFADQQTGQTLKSTIQSIHKIQQAMIETGAKVENIQLHYGTDYKTYAHIEDVKVLAEKLGESMGMTPVRESINVPPPHEYHYQRLDQHIVTTLRVIAIPSHTQSEKWDSYVTINMVADPQAQDGLEEGLARLYQSLETVEIVPQFNSCVQGIVDDKLGNDVQREHMKYLLDYFGAEVVEKVEDHTVKSYSAFSQEFPSYIWTKDKKMNVQAAMHVDQLHDLTRLTIGTPIITVEY